MLKKILFLTLTVALMAGCHGPARGYYRSVHYSPSSVVVYKPAPAVYRSAPPPPVAVYKPAPPPVIVHKPAPAAYQPAPPPRQAPNNRPAPPPERKGRPGEVDFSLHRRR